MNTTYKKYPPKELFISFIGREAREEELWMGVPEGIVYHKPTGNEFLDHFAQLVHRYMNHQPAFYARLLGVTSAELSGCLKVLTGLTADEWLAAYRRMAIRDLLLHTDWRLTRVAERTGYKSVKTFSNAFIKRVGMSPSHWRKKYKGKE